MIDEKERLSLEWTDERRGQEEDENHLEWCNIDAMKAGKDV